MANKKKQEIEDIEEYEELDEEEEEIEVKKTKATKNTKDEDFSEEVNDLTIEDRIINIENKVNILLFVTLICTIICVILLFGTFSSKDSATDNPNSNNDTGQTASNYYYDTSAFKEITAEDIKNESKSETIVVMIGRQGCSACYAYAPIITSVAKDFGITIRYIDLAKIVNFNVKEPYITDSAAFSTLTSLTGSGKWESFVSSNIQGTPLTIIIKNNKVVGGIAGAYEASYIEEAFTEAGLSK